MSDQISTQWIDPRTVTLTFDADPPQGTLRVETDGGGDELAYR